MSELKRSFSGAKMNKDLDERLVQDGDYRDALNIQVTSSDGSNVGTAQNLLGNELLTSGKVPAGSRVVGSITDGENDDIYMFVTGPRDGYAITTNTTLFTDWIVRWNVTKEEFTYVFVDHYRVHSQIIGITTTTVANDTIEISESNYIKEGSFVNGASIDSTFVSSTFTPGTTNYPAIGAANQKIIINESSGGFAVGDEIRFNVAPGSEVLGFRRLNYGGTFKLVTGINIIDNMLFWTDSLGEPKKINIDRSIAGTGGSNKLNIGDGDHDTYPTRLVIKHENVTNLDIAKSVDENRALFVEDFHITVIRPNPTTPPVLEMSTTASVRETSAGVANSIATTITTSAFFQDDDVAGTFEAASGIISLTFDDNVDYRPGDIIFFSRVETVDELENGGPTLFSDDPESEYFVNDTCRVQILPNPNSEDGLYNLFPDNIQAGVFQCQILAVSSIIPPQAPTYSFYTRLAQEDPLFEFKFPRFAYRYKYVDGEYSAFSPFSEIAFLPGRFDYFPKKGHNLGMVNNLRSLKIRDYVMDPAMRPQDIIEVDILYKEDSSPTVYTVKTIKPYDREDDADRIWPISYNDSEAWGEFELTSEMIHAVVPSNQILRPWDNVPRKALAQEVSSNRLIYGNYTQNYDLIDISNKEIKPKISLSLEAGESLLATGTFPDPSKSVKSIRTYQVGVVYGDRFGRETPVLADKKQGSIYVDKSFSCTANRLKARILSKHPKWAKYFKFFLKETSNEYYNLAMDRWYDAEDGNIWISFPSSDRNKLDIDTYLILKKAHDSDTCITEKARYNILAVENEAPLFIKLNKKSQGVFTDTDNDAIGDTNSGFPFADFTFCILDGASLEAAFDMEDIRSKGNAAISFSQGENRSELYDCSIALLENNNYKFTVDGGFNGDVDFLTTGGTYATRISNIKFEIIRKEYEDKPEFDGRFFVKIYKDLVLQTNVLDVGIDDNLLVTDTYAVDFIHSFNTSTVGNLVTDLEADDTNNLGITSTFTGSSGTYDWGEFGTANGGSSGNFNFDPGDGSTNNDVDMHELDHRSNHAKEFWEEWYTHGNQKAQLFIDSAFAYEYNSFTACGVTLDDGSDFWDNWDGWSDNVNGVQTNQQCSSAWGNGSGTHGNGTFRNKPFGVTGDILDLSVVGWSDRSDWSESEYDNDGGPGVGLIQQNFYTAGFYNEIANSNEIKSFLNTIKTNGQRWRWQGDPNEVVYETTNSFVHYGINNYKVSDAGKKHYFNGGAMRTKTSIQFTPSSNGNWNPCQNMRHDGSESTVIELLSPGGAADSDITFQSDNPAIWETEPKESVDVDIYYEASHAYPIEIETELGHINGVNIRSNEEAWARQNSTLELLQTDTGTSTIPSGTKFASFSTSVPGPNKLIKLTASANVTLAVGDIIGITTPHNDTVSFEVKTATANTFIEVEEYVHNNEIALGWFNCYSYGNGVESNRIRDDFNQSFIAKGVKASTTIAEPYAEEVRGSGFIFSGIYNSISGVNNLNQFIQAEPITKDLNPDHGSIQKLYTRETNILTLCEDKCLTVLANKDALFNADGSSNVTSSKNVLGSATPLAGDFGISQNPESFAADSDTVYFTDRQRNAVVSIAGGSAMPISDFGMKDYFTDTYKLFNERYRFIGSFDDKKEEYNLTLSMYDTSKPQNQFVRTPITLSYSPSSKGWVSFKSFIPEGGISINNEYYTFYDGDLWKHHKTEDPSNNFYGTQYDSHVELLFNDSPAMVKSFGSINYEGTQSKIDEFASVVQDSVTYTDQDFYNLTAKKGWYVDNIITDLQTGKASNFRNKEGKWFGNIMGDNNFSNTSTPTTLGNESYKEYDSSGNVTAPYILDTEEFTTQGIGMATLDSDETGVTLGNTDFVYQLQFANTQHESTSAQSIQLGNIIGNQTGYALYSQDGSAAANAAAGDVVMWADSDRYTEWDKPNTGGAGQNGNQHNALDPGMSLYTTEEIEGDSIAPDTTLQNINKVHSRIFNTVTGVVGASFTPPPMVGYMVSTHNNTIDKTMFHIDNAMETFAGSCIWNTAGANVDPVVSQVEFINHAEMESLIDTYYSQFTAAFSKEAWQTVNDTCGVIDPSTYGPLNPQGLVGNVVWVVATYVPNSCEFPAADDSAVTPRNHWIDIDYKEQTNLTNSLGVTIPPGSNNMTELSTNIAFELSVEMTPNQITTVADVAANAPYTLVSETPRTMGTDDDGVITANATQKFVYYLNKFEKNADGDPSEVVLPVVTTTCTTSHYIQKSNSSVELPDGSLSNSSIRGAKSTNYSDVNSAGTALSRVMTETFKFIPTKTRESWEQDDKTSALAIPVKFSSKVAAKTIADVAIDPSANKVIRNLNLTGLDKLHKQGGARKIRVSGDVGAKYKLIIKDSTGKTYNPTTFVFDNARKESEIPEITLTSNTEVHNISFPATTTELTYRVFLEVGASTTLASGIPADENAAAAKIQYPDVVLTYGLSESTDGNWTQPANVTATGIVNDEGYRKTAIAFSFDTTSSASAGGATLVAPITFENPATGNNGWEFEAKITTFQFNFASKGANVLTIAGNLFIEKYGTSDLTATIDIDEVVTF